MEQNQRLTKNVWLFNIHDDSTESNDLADTHEDVVKLLLGKLSGYQKSAVAPDRPLPDNDANPSLHGNVWLPWRTS